MKQTMQRNCANVDEDPDQFRSHRVNSAVGMTPAQVILWFCPKMVAKDECFEQRSEWLNPGTGFFYNSTNMPDILKIPFD